MSKAIKIIIPLVVIIGVIIAGVMILNSPSIVTARAASGIVDDVLDRNEVAPIVKILKGGSIEASVKQITENGKKLENFESAAGKLYFSKDALYLTDVELKANKNTIAGEMYVSKDMVYVNEEKILGDTYGINFATLADDLADSIFAADSKSEYALSKDDYEKIMNALESMKENENLEKDLTSLTENILADIWKIAIENAEITSETKNVRLNGDKKSVRLITIVIDGNAMENIISDIYNYLLDSDEIIDFIDKYEDILLTVCEDIYDEYEYDSLSEAYIGLLEEAEDTVDEMCDNASEMDEITVELATPKLTSDLLKLEVSMDNDTVISIDCGPNGLKKTDKITIELFESQTIVYEIKENSREELKATLTMEYGNSKDTFTVDIDKERETYAISSVHTYTYKSSYAYASYTSTDTYKITGTISQKDDTTTLTVDKITNKYVYDADGSYDDSTSEYTYKLDCTIIIDTSDRMPTPDNDFKTIADITEKNIKSWIEKLDKIF